MNFFERAKYSIFQGFLEFSRIFQGLLDIMKILTVFSVNYTSIKTKFSLINENTMLNFY